MTKIILLLMTLFSVSAFAKDTTISNLGFVVSKNIEIEKDASSVRIADAIGAECILFFQAVPFKRKLAKGTQFLVQSSSEDTRNLSADDLAKMANASFGIKLEVNKNEGADKFSKRLHELFGVEAATEILVTRFQLMSKKNNRSAALECWNTNTEASLEGLNSSGSFNPSADF
jgi:hypothetical protein